MGSLHGCTEANTEMMCVFPAPLTQFIPPLTYMPFKLGRYRINKQSVADSNMGERYCPCPEGTTFLLRKQDKIYK